MTAKAMVLKRKPSESAGEYAVRFVNSFPIVGGEQFMEPDVETDDIVRELCTDNVTDRRHDKR